MLRRNFLRQSALFGGACAWQTLLPPWARAAEGLAQPAAPPGNEFDLHVAASSVQVAGKRARPITINGQFPAPLLRWREGDELTLRVHNALSEDTSIHWHGILLPAAMDGVPGVSFPGIAPGASFTYRFALRQSGTYWYHSHSGLQEQLGHYGPIIIDPREPEPYAYEREYVILLSDWTFEDPQRVYAKLKKMSDTYNYNERTIFDFFRDARDEGLDAALAERMMWGDMRMSPTDLADVTSATYTYLINGHSPAENFSALFTPGERVRLRFINAAAMSLFNVRIPGLPLTVVQADGLNVQPVITDEFQIGVAETYDVIVQPMEDRAYTLMAETSDFYGYARATLTPRLGLTAPVPALRPRPLLTMKDMGMGEMAHDMSAMPEAMDHSQMEPAAMDHSTMDHSMMMMEPAAMDHSAMDPSMMMMEPAAMDHSAMDHSMMMEPAPPPAEAMSPMPPVPYPHHHATGPGVESLASNPVTRLHERPLGLEHEAHRVLVYSELRSLSPRPDARAPEREVELHLTGNMRRYMWSFDGLKLPQVSGPIPMRLGERLRWWLVNDTMMPHPVHLHGMFFDLVTGDDTHPPRKHTLVLKPGERAAIDLSADALGDWAFHC
ncbi:MAG: copper resistance system multicopper oxidase, partial [Pseudomonadales bacterium]|nr:copper resistance system multicopper oxidase [Pseudomonadales bacterium]